MPQRLLASWSMIVAVVVIVAGVGFLLINSGNISLRNGRDNAANGDADKAARRAEELPEVELSAERQAALQDAAAAASRPAQSDQPGGGVQGVRPATPDIAKDALPKVAHNGGTDSSPGPRRGPTNPDETREQLIKRLYASLRGAKGEITEEVARQITAIREAGYDPAGALLELYDDNAAVRDRAMVVLALRKVAGSDALAALRKIAQKPGPDDLSLAGPLVKAVAEISNANPNEISKLLGSDSPRIRDEAAAALRSTELTEESVQRLGELLYSDSWVTHNLVGTAFATDQSTTTAGRKINLLLAALPQLEHLTDVQEGLPYSGTARDRAMNSYTVALAKMPGADKILRDKLSTTDPRSPEHRVLAVALGLRKDKVAHPWLIEIARNDPNGLVRSLAVTGLGLIGSVQDIGLLESLAAIDPYTQKGGDDDPGVVVYPVRFAAKRAIEILQKRSRGDP